MSVSEVEPSRRRMIPLIAHRLCGRVDIAWTGSAGPCWKHTDSRRAETESAAAAAVTHPSSCSAVSAGAEVYGIRPPCGIVVLAAASDTRWSSHPCSSGSCWTLWHGRARCWMPLRHRSHRGPRENAELVPSGTRAGASTWIDLYRRKRSSRRFPHNAVTRRIDSAGRCLHLAPRHIHQTSIWPGRVPQRDE
jgi:hypothetical protein